MRISMYQTRAVKSFAALLLLTACNKRIVDLSPADGKAAATAVSTTDTIPLKNAYGIPDENNIGISGTGIGNWTSSNDSARVYVTFNNTGSLTVSLLAKSPDGAGSVTVSIAGKKFTVNVPQSTSYQKITAGTVNITGTGISYFTIKGATKPGGYYADVSNIIISGSPANNAYYNKSDWRTCPAVHMGYTIATGDTARWFYNEIKIPSGSDVVNTFFMANGFYNGYFGIQVNSPTERRILFSIWSDYNTNDPGQVPANYAVQLVQKGSLVTTEENFGNEGTGRHAYAIYNWHTDSTYKFLVHSVPDAGGVTYSGYIFLNNQWQLIATYYKPVGTYNMTGLYSFIEDFGGGLNSYKQRNMLVQNQWIVTPNGTWKQLKTAHFTTTTHDDVYSRVDYGAAASGPGYNYFTSGFVPKTASDNQQFTCGTGTQPVVTLPQ
ncbi:DUF3472 domain-containing protein [Deminuibacter soli]|uniref:DUF5077 domain-containing protein n=1 Tax=Deminuibacter soli TaxID=2291815 RepID=A0A3E1NK09_9BACT|nr:DUF5077 domain-containing protein [Deminuibacter soli]RFM28276.1 DUF5077 domain-containing protein [Deminuibacter soli]